MKYEEIFERSGRWLMGPAILAAICRHWRGKTPGFKASNHGVVTPIVPAVPNVANIDGRWIPITDFIPVELLPIYYAAEEVALGRFTQRHAATLERFIGRAITSVTLAEMKQSIANEERVAEARDDPSGQFYNDALAAFGLTETALAIKPPFQFTI